MKRTSLIALLLLQFSFVSFAQNNLVESIKAQFAPDRRTAIWKIKVDTINDTLFLKGKTDKLDAYNAFIDSLRNQNVTFVDSIKVLPEDEKLQWGLVCLPLVHLRTNPGHASELTSQALMGTPVKILENEDGWLHVQTPDNYISWVMHTGIKQLNDKQFNEWKSKKRYVVTANLSYIYKDEEFKEVVSDIVLGDILECVKESRKSVKLTTPDGREGYARKSDLKEIAEWANQTFNPELIIRTAKQLMGSCYTWGGTSTKGVDCSGLTKTCYFANAIILQRDASQQVLYGMKIAPKDWKQAQKGDLLYFGTKSGKVTHTAIYMNDGHYIHSSGRVKVNSVDPKADSYLTTPFLSINRIVGNVDSPGIYSVKNHPWYF